MTDLYAWLRHPAVIVIGGVALLAVLCFIVSLLEAWRDQVKYDNDQYWRDGPPLKMYLMFGDEYYGKHIKSGTLKSVCRMLYWCRLPFRWGRRRVFRLYENAAYSGIRRSIGKRYREFRWGDLCRTPTHELVMLVGRGAVKVTGTGCGIQDIEIKIENRTGRSLHIVVEEGTQVNAKGGHQNMVVTRRRTFNVPPDSHGNLRKNIRLDAACVNAGRPIPQPSNNFSGVSRVAGDVKRLLQAEDRPKEFWALQAAIWAVTDGLSATQVRERVTVREQGPPIPSGLGTFRYKEKTVRPITDLHCNEAKDFLRRLGIKNNL